MSTFNEFLVNSYKRKRYLPLRKLEFSISRRDPYKYRTTYREVIYRQTEVFKPRWSKWSEQILTINRRKRINDKIVKNNQTLNLLFPKSLEKFREEKRNDIKTLKKQGFNRMVLLTHNNRDYLIIEGNHRASVMLMHNTFYPLKKGRINKKFEKKKYNVYVGVVSREVYDNWKKWSDRNIEYPSTLKNFST